MMRNAAVFLGVATLALAGCDRVEWHLGQDQKDDEPATLDELVEAVDELASDEQAAAADDADSDEPIVVDLGISGEGVLAIVGARILTMDGAPIERGTVLIKDGTILALGSNVRIPDGAEELNAKGLTMMPGLVDMHVHHWSEAEGPLYVANGITTVRNLWGTNQTIRLDEGAKNGAYVGPRVFTPGPLTDGPEPIWGESSLVIETADQAIGAVRAQKAAGFTAVKLYERLPADAYRAAVAEAKRLDMDIYTHTPAALTVSEVLDLEVDSLEHMDNVSTAIVSSEFKDVEGRSSNLGRWAAVDPSKAASLASEFAEHGVASSVTLAVTINRYEYMLDTDGFWSSERARYVPASTREWWDDSAANAAPLLTRELVRDARAGQLSFVKALHDAGAPLLIGTDTPNPFVVQGFAMHDELSAFVEAGIPASEVLEMATAGAAAFLGAEDSFGRVAEGLRADLVLVKGNPERNISALKEPAYVILGGDVYDRTALEELLEDIAAEIESAATAE